MHTRLIVLVLALSPIAVAQPKDDFKPSPTTAHPRSTGAVPQDVLDDFIAGFNGDEASMTRAMAATDAILAKDPTNAEALAWNSSGKGMQCGAAFRTGDFQTGMRLWQESQDGLNKAVDMDPNNARIRIVRGKSMLEGSLHDPNPETSTAAAAKSVDDLESALSIMGDNFEKNAPKSFRQEMYSWLYQGAAKTGDKEKADKYKKLAGDAADQAKQRLEQSAGNTVNEAVFAATTILDSQFVQDIKPDLTAGLRTPAKLDDVIASLDKKIEAKRDDATAIAWRGFARALRSQSYISQGNFETGTKMWEKGNAEISEAASTDATNRDAVLLRGLSNVEWARKESDEAKRTDAANKAVTDLTRFQRVTTDTGATMTGDAKAELNFALARAYRASGQLDKAKTSLEAAIAANPSPEIAKRLKSLLELMK
jgi:tetratricopeptide (TPR) repeat protein